MIRTRSTFLALLAVLLSPTAANADVILAVDLSVPDTITITATTGLSGATVSGSDTTGFYLTSFFDGDPGSFSVTTNGSLTSAQDTSDGTPILFAFGFDTGGGVNIWSTANSDPLDFVAGQLAFSGTATWTVANAIYLAALAGPGAGDVYFPADDIGDLNDTQLLGTWAVASVPEPGTIALLGLGLVGMAARRRKV